MHSILFIVTVMILDCSLRGRVIDELALQDRKQIVGAANKMHGSRRLSILAFRFFSLRFLVHAVLLQEELVMKLQIRVISDLFPCAVTVTGNTNAEHAIFPCAPRTRIAGAFCSLRDTKALRIGRPRCDITKKSHFARSIQNCLSVESLHAMKLKQDSLLVFLGNRPSCILLQSLHSFL